MKLLVVKPYIVFILFATVLNLAGCAILLNPKTDTQEITFEAEDGREYDFLQSTSSEAKLFTGHCFMATGKNGRRSPR